MFKKMFFGTTVTLLSIHAGLLLLRVVSGLFMVTHGMPKLISFGERAEKFPDPLGVGSQLSLGLTVFSEVFCAIFLVLGLMGRVSATLLAFTMLVAAFVIHAGDPFHTMEKALLFAVIYIFLALTGPGKISLDSFIGAKR